MLFRLYSIIINKIYSDFHFHLIILTYIQNVLIFLRWLKLKLKFKFNMFFFVEFESISLLCIFNEIIFFFLCISTPFKLSRYWVGAHYVQRQDLCAIFLEFIVSKAKTNIIHKFSLKLDRWECYSASKNFWIAFVTPFVPFSTIYSYSHLTGITHVVQWIYLHC